MTDTFIPSLNGSARVITPSRATPASIPSPGADRLDRWSPCGRGDASVRRGGRGSLALLQGRSNSSDGLDAGPEDVDPGGVRPGVDGDEEEPILADLDVIAEADDLPPV
jgi:hypothetical protein